MCGICGKGKNTYLCKKCKKRLKIDSVFKKDTYQNKYYNNHIYFFRYEGIVRNLLLNYKFNEKPYLYKSFINFFETYNKEFSEFDIYDIIIPVPISKKRLKVRGYNQSYLIAKEIAKNLNIKLENGALIKEKNNITQSTLNKDGREENVKGVYKIIDKEKVQNKKILLIDDIYTTGSTVNECSKELILAGAKIIDVFTIAKD